MSGSKKSDKQEQKPLPTELKTAPFDPRYPNANQTRYCYNNYVDFQRCELRRGKEYEPCQYFKRIFTSMCPNEWVKTWDEQQQNGNFPVKF